MFLPAEFSSMRLCIFNLIYSVLSHILDVFVMSNIKYSSTFENVLSTEEVFILYKAALKPYALLKALYK